MKNKIKTHKATSKRFKLTKNNKLRHNRQGDNAHLKTNKNRAEKARKKGKVALKSTTQKNKLIRYLAK